MTARSGADDPSEERLARQAVPGSIGLINKGKGMPTMNISLPEELQAFFEAQLSHGSYASASACVRSLIP
jgi:hypothetical protein